MNLNEVIKFILSRNSLQIKNTKHSAIRLEERNIKFEEVISSLNYESLLSITKQGDNVYKLLTTYNKYLDLAIIVRMYGDTISIITVFKSDINNRMRNERSK